MKNLVPPKLFTNTRLFERFFRYTFGIAGGYQIRERQILLFSTMVEYGISITATAYWRMLQNYAETKDLANAVKVWNLVWRSIVRYE